MNNLKVDKYGCMESGMIYQNGSVKEGVGKVSLYEESLVINIIHMKR
jgi:hypothetical protein